MAAPALREPGYTRISAGLFQRAPSFAHYTQPVPSTTVADMNPISSKLRPGIELIDPSDLDSGLMQTWRQLQAGNPLLRSPFFSLAFLQVVADVRSDVKIAILRDGDTIKGFFPFHRRPGARGAPLAAPIADYQGIVGEAPEALHPRDLLVACGLSTYDFDHALRDTPLFERNAFRRTGSPLIDLSDGIEAWRAGRMNSGSALKNVERKLRKMERELGPVRFETDDKAADTWTTFLTWKRAAIAAMGARFVLDQPWAMQVLERIRGTDQPEFSGRLSSLYAGDRLVAAHFGMRSENTWHWWFPTYDNAASRYTPGLGLLLHCVRQAAKEGLTEIDLGRGDERYKKEFANETRALCEGSLERGLTPPGAARRFRKFTYRTAETVLPPRYLDLKRRAFNRLLRAGQV